MKFFEPVDLGENWVAVNIPNSFSSRGQILISHRCDPSAATIKRIQKTTHRRHGVRWRCNNCKAIAPKYVIVFMTLHKIHERVNG